MDDRTAIEAAGRAFLDHWMGMTGFHQWLRETAIPWKDLVLLAFLPLDGDVPAMTALMMGDSPAIFGPLLRLDDETQFRRGMHTFVHQVLPESARVRGVAQALSDCLIACRQHPPAEHCLHAIVLAQVKQRPYTILVELGFPHTEPLPSEPLPSDLN